MYGAITGGIVGSRFEFNNVKTREFDLFHPECRFADDTVMTLAVAQAIMRYGYANTPFKRDLVFVRVGPCGWAAAVRHCDGAWDRGGRGPLPFCKYSCHVCGGKVSTSIGEGHGGSRLKEERT